MYKAIVAISSFVLAGAASAAAGATSVDAPGDILLFALGVGGVMIGRKLHRKLNRQRRGGKSDG